MFFYHVLLARIELASFPSEGNILSIERQEQDEELVGAAGNSKLTVSVPR